MNNKQEKVIVVDPKGELYDMKSEIELKQGCEVHRFDLIRNQKITKGK
ncbi:type IV secretory system conjugative DNA transfer family protein [Bacillus safensis]|nr:type IV secretory system conjugative DNA transfer family protein [Bacillus safensis]